MRAMGWTVSAVVSFGRVASLVSRHAVIGEYDRKSRMLVLPVLLEAWQTSETGQARRRQSPSHPAL